MNNRIYPEEIFQKEIKKYLKKINIKHRKDKIQKIKENINGI